MTTNSHFRIGDGVGLVGRWFRLFIGAYFVVFLVLNPILLHPIPIAQLLRGAWKGYRSATDASGMIGNYLLGAGVLVLALLVFVVDGLSDSAVWRSIMVLGGLVVVGELLQRAASALRKRAVSTSP